jgi:SAM-dependent methyltransferase
MVDTWDLIKTWELVLPPSRPSARQIELLRTRLSIRERTAPVGILGSTPEFRDLVYEMGFQQVFVFDRNAGFYAAMSEARIYKSPEQLVVGDWLHTLPNYRGVFTAILSDLTMGNVEYERRQNFYESIANALMQSGIFVDKVLTHPCPHIPVADLVVKYSKLPINLLSVNNFSCEMFFCSELVSGGIVDSAAFYTELEGAVKNLRVQAFIKSAPKITPSGCVWYYGRPWSEIQHTYGAGLRKLEAEDDEQGSPYFGRLQFFVQERL